MPGIAGRLVCLLLAATLPIPPAAAAAAAVPPDSEIAAVASGERTKSWLLKWETAGDARKLPGTTVLHRQEQTNVEVVRPNPGVDLGLWLAQLRKTDGVEYVQPNGTVRLLAANDEPNDPELDKQAYLRQIRADKAWTLTDKRTDITIALVDTGVDLDHPDLQANLVAGTNLVEPGKPPEDDNGHGTNVAGVVAAIGNNGIGTAGILWKAGIMPIKALDNRGFGDEDRLGEAILYAVNRGAKIVVLSVGLYRYSPYMRDIVQYAESKGVLLVAAAGNDGELLGSKAAVKYPAAYPTVLAVSGATAGGTPEKRSNPGPEIDVAASWNVYTTALGGGYTSQEGTSMAAPQAAAAAALVWMKYPDFKPYQVLELLKQTAKDIGIAGRDERSGYGLLQLDAALTAKLKDDVFEPNNSRQTAGPLPLNDRNAAALNGGADRDWYKINAPYDGTLVLSFQALADPGTPLPPVRISQYDAERVKGETDVKIGNKTVEWQVRKGVNYVNVQFTDAKREGVIPYLITAEFRMAEDGYERNDRNYEAFTLAPQTQAVAGNFHQTGDKDWYTVTFTQAGSFKVELETDTVRIDPAFTIQKTGEAEVYVDDYGDGESERSPTITVTPGSRYYIRVHNASAAEASPVPGTYKLSLLVQTRYVDPNEPNDRAFASTPISPGTEYVGVIGKPGDQDWFQLRLNEPYILTMTLSDIAGAKAMRFEVYDKRQKLLYAVQPEAGSNEASTDRLFEPGTYYVKVTADMPFDNRYYRFKTEADQLVAGYRDIDKHWAQAAIISLNQRGIVGGTGDYRFEPDKGISRAEAVAIVVRAFGKGTKRSAASFPDVPKGYWAGGSIAAAEAQGWLAGLPDGTFAPQRLISRAEIAVMLGRALGMIPLAVSGAPFADLDRDHWAAPMLYRLRQAGVIGGYPGNTVRPDETASRAEFSSMIYRALAGKD